MAVDATSWDPVRPPPYQLIPRAVGVGMVPATVAPPEPEPSEPPKVRGVIRDVQWLAPAFRARIVDGVLPAMRALGHEPVVWETLRTAERAEWLQARGSSRNGRRSMHLYGVACDIICLRHRWDCPNIPDCDFYRQLGIAARAQRLHWGGDWQTLVDRPHVQAVPIGMQGRVRTTGDVDGLVATYLSARPARMVA